VFFWKNKALVGHITDLATLAANNYKVSEIHPPAIRSLHSDFERHSAR
jgi:hypothetical protein